MSQINEEALRILSLLKLDSKRLFERIKFRSAEYLYIFSVKRSREHFRSVFKNRYDDLDIAHLKHCGQEVIVGLDQFYSKVDEIRWYLNSTEDMPGTVDDKVHAHIRELEPFFQMLSLYIDAEFESYSSNEPSDSDVNEEAELSTEVSEDLLKELSV